MRQLKISQKKLLKKWFIENYKGGYMFNMADKIDFKLYQKIENINPTEIHYNNVNNYLEELVDKKNQINERLNLL
tara:strand:- start:717 stop:941 length:225 start_codon:yes stop_codon:yes gene_type:complete